METRKFHPDLKAIEQREKIAPFGRAAKQERSEPASAPFILYNTEQTIKTDQGEPVGLYRPAAMFQHTVTARSSSEVSVKITNVPLHITYSMLVETIMKEIKASTIRENTGMGSFALRPFTRLNLVLDKETRVSRGYAYANCETLEKARELAKVIRGITIDACVLGAEVLDK